MFHLPNAPTTNILELLTKAIASVAFDFQSNAANPAMNEKKQVPSLVSMLTKNLYLAPKMD